MESRTLKVPGATLYYEVRGAGPVLLMIPGGPMDAGGFAPLADCLADRCAVVTNYAPDLGALRASATRVVVGVGDESGDGQLAYRTALALAAALGVEPVSFPGDHGGFAGHTEAFAARLHDVLGGQAG